MDYIVAKYSENQILVGSQMIVEPSQTAFFVRKGSIFDEFSEGTHEVNREKLPLLSKSLEIPKHRNRIIDADVWIVNHATITNLKWETKKNNNSVVNDPIYNISIRFKSYGEYSIRIDNPRLFIENVASSAYRVWEVNTEKVTNYFLGIINRKFKIVVREILTKNNKSILEIKSLQDMVETRLYDVLLKEFLAKGVVLDNFKIRDITIDKADSSYPYLKRAIQKCNNPTNSDINNEVHNQKDKNMIYNIQNISQPTEIQKHSVQKASYLLYECSVANLNKKQFDITRLPGVYDYEDIIYMIQHNHSKLSLFSLFLQVVETFCQHYSSNNRDNPSLQEWAYSLERTIRESRVKQMLFLNKQSFLKPIQESLSSAPRDRKKYLDKIYPTILIWRSGCKHPCFWDELPEFGDLYGATNSDIDDLKLHLSNLL